jgi:hypothetical protein
MNYEDFENLNDQVNVWKTKKSRAVPVLVIIDEKIHGHVSNISGC